MKRKALGILFLAIGGGILLLSKIKGTRRGSSNYFFIPDYEIPIYRYFPSSRYTILDYAIRISQVGVYISRELPKELKNEAIVYNIPEKYKHVLKYFDYIKEASEKYGIPEEFIIAIIYNESRGKPNAVGRAGEIGLMQILPRTALYLSRLGYCDIYISSEDEIKRYLFDPRYNIMCGTAYLKYLVDKIVGEFDPFLLAIGYNAGETRLRRYIETGNIDVIPPSTLEYVNNVVNKYYAEILESIRSYIA